MQGTHSLPSAQEPWGPVPVLLGSFFFYPSILSSLLLILPCFLWLNALPFKLTSHSFMAPGLGHLLRPKSSHKMANASFLLVVSSFPPSLVYLLLPC